MRVQQEDQDRRKLWAHNSSWCRLCRTTSNRHHYQPLCHSLLANVSVLQDSRGRQRPCFMKCDHSSKWQWCLKCITSIRKRCGNMKTREMLTTILTDGIQVWFTEATLQPGNYPHAFRQLIQEQNDIRWRQLFNGRISNDWQ
jgi:hypothetical protein